MKWVGDLLASVLPTNFGQKIVLQVKKNSLPLHKIRAKSSIFRFYGKKKLQKTFTIVQKSLIVE